MVREKKDTVSSSEKANRTTKSADTTKKKPKIKKAQPLHWAVGRRKRASARVRIENGTGTIVVNGHDYATYFDTESTRDEASLPCTVCPFATNYNFVVSVHGGGKVGQAQAVKLGIARVLLDADSNIKSLLRQHGLLSVDARKKERKKYGQRGARRKFQFVKR